MNNLPEHQLDALLALPPADIPVVLFARHSIRELAAHGSVNYQLPLTQEGIDLAKAWGARFQRKVTNFFSSPVQRCVDTAELMAEGMAFKGEVTKHKYLVEPGCYVIEMQKVGHRFLELGPVGFANEHFALGFPGVLSPEEGAKKLLSHFIENLCPEGGMSIHISHDTILAAFVYCLLQKGLLSDADWPEMMEGIFLWFENANHDPINPRLETSVYVRWIWRGQSDYRKLQDFEL